MAKMLLKDRLKKRREEIKAKSQSGDIFFIKADTIKRVRIIGGDENEEFLKEITQFYLGSEIKGVVSPATVNEPCAIMESFDELKNSKDDDDKALAKTFVPRQKYLAFCILYKDEAGKVVDEENSPKWVLCTGGMYQDIIDLYLDESDWGDMTDKENGYDLKFGRTGSGKTDTEYSVVACKNTPLPKAFRNKTFKLDEELRAIIPSYEQTKNLIAQFLNLDPEDDNEKPVKKGMKKLKKDLD